MKIVFADDKIIVFFKHFQLEENKNLEETLKDLLLQLECKYNLEIQGYYEITLYSDSYYCSILEIESVDIDYYQFLSQVELKINVVKISDFLYQIEYGMLPKEILKKCICYQQKQDLYVQLKESLNEYQMAQLLEISNIIYGKDANQIIKYGKKVKV